MAAAAEWRLLIMRTCSQHFFFRGHGPHLPTCPPRPCRATSASDLSKYEPQQPLQDNVEIGLRWLVARYPGAAAAALSWRVDMHALLYCFVALCLSAAWDAIEFSGFGVAT